MTLFAAYETTATAAAITHTGLLYASKEQGPAPPHAIPRTQGRARADRRTAAYSSAVCARARVRVPCARRGGVPVCQCAGAAARSSGRSAAARAYPEPAR